MFEALKKKLASWLGKPEKKKVKKAEKKPSRKEKKERKGKKKKEIIEKIKKEVEKPVEIIKEPEPKIELYDFKKPKKAKEKESEEEAEEIIEEVEVQEIGEKESAEELVEESKSERKEEIIKEVEEPKKEGFFSKLFKKFQSAKITQENFEEIFRELEMILLENNVALEVVEKIKEDLALSLIGEEIKRTEIEKVITDALKNSILNLLIEPSNLMEKIKAKKSGEPFVILFFGINGSGKTTSIAKLAYKLKKQNISTLMAAADTFRAASIEQLQTHGTKLGIEVISKEYGTDPSAVAFDAIQHAKKNNVKVVLIDTAGRMYTKSNLMKEMEKIVRVSKPDLKIFVGESITGNDATEQAKTFNETAGIDGIVLSKADVDEKAGTILSVSYVTKKPIYYLGTGQNYEDLQEFKKANVLEHLGLE
jgi:fused signal recognition particle receptor